MRHIHLDQVTGFLHGIMSNMDYKPLSPESERRLKDLYYSGNMFGRDRLYYAFKQKFPDDPLNCRALYAWLDRQEVHQIHQRPTMKRGIVRPMVAQKLGSVQIDYLDLSKNPYNGFNAIMEVVDIFSKKYYAYPCKGQTVANTIKAMETSSGQG